MGLEIIITLARKAVPFLLKHWYAVVVSVCVALTVSYGIRLRHDRDREMVLKGQAEAAQAFLSHINRVQDSTIGVQKKVIDSLDKRLAGASQIVTRLIVQRDTVQKWRTDTLYAADSTPVFQVPVSEVAKDDTAKKACVEVRNDCKAKQDALNKEIDAWIEKYNALQQATGIPAQVAKSSSVKKDVALSLFGMVVGAVADHYIARR